MKPRIGAPYRPGKNAQKTSNLPNVTPKAVVNRVQRNTAMNAIALLPLLAPIPQAADLAADPRLKAPITISSAAENCQAVCRKLTEITKVTIRTHEYQKDDLIVLFAKDRPAHEVLTQLAKHFKWEWIKDGDGYLLRMPSGAVEKERAEMRKQILKPYLELQAKWRKSLTGPPSDLQSVMKRLGELEAGMDKILEDETDDKQDWKAYSLLQEESAKLQQQVDPSARFAETLFCSLTESQLLELDNRERLVFSYRPTRMQYGLGSFSSAADQLVSELFQLREAKKAAVQQAPNSQEGYEGSSFVQTFRTNVKPDDIFTVRCVFSRSSWGSSDVSVNSEIAILDTKLNRIFSGGGISDSPAWEKIAEMRGGAKPKEGEPEPEIVKQLPNKIENPSKELSEAFSPVSIMKEMLLTMFGGQFENDPLRSSARRQIALAEAAGVSLVGDAYDNQINYIMAGPEAAGGFERTASVGKLFSGLATQQRSKATYDGGWVKLRADDWEYCRACSLPRFVLQSMSKSLRDTGGVPIQDYMNVATQITDYQGRSPLLVDLLSMGGQRGSGNLYFLRGLAQLSATQRQALDTGAKLSFSDMPPGARAAFWEYMYRRDYASGRLSVGVLPDMGFGMSEDIGPDGEPSIEDARVAEEQIAIKGRQDLELQTIMDDPELVILTPDHEITQVLPNGPESRSTLELKLKKSNGLSSLLEFMGIQVPIVMPVSMMLMMTEMAENGDEFRPTVKGMRAAALSDYNFILRMTEDVTGKFVYTSATTSGAFGDEASLPPGLKKELGDMRKKFKEMQSKGGGGDGGEPPPPPR